eukprot:GSA25T00018409001.1
MIHQHRSREFFTVQDTFIKWLAELQYNLNQEDHSSTVRSPSSGASPSPEDWKTVYLELLNLGLIEPSGPLVTANPRELSSNKNGGRGSHSDSCTNHGHGGHGGPRGPASNPAKVRARVGMCVVRNDRDWQYGNLDGRPGLPGRIVDIQGLYARVQWMEEQVVHADASGVADELQEEDYGTVTTSEHQMNSGKSFAGGAGKAASSGSSA